MSPRAAFLADFGASRVKGALYHLAEQRIVARSELPAPEPRWGERGEVEVDPGTYAGILQRLIGGVSGAGLSPDAIWLCSEMHGFVLDDGKGRALTPYVSWRDTRSAHTLPGDNASLHESLRAEMGDEFLRITGMQLRPGTPLLGLLHLAQQRRLPASARFLSLPEWIAASGDGSTGKAHVTIAAASGLYDIERSAWSDTLLARLARSGLQLALAESRPDDDVLLGQVRVGDRLLPLLGGYGDMQTALYGAGLPRQAALALNVGTGSQAARCGELAMPGIEVRPFFGGSRLAAITHIPSGRALNLFARLFDDRAANAVGDGPFWRRLAVLDANEILAAPLRVDLNVFPGSWKYRDGGSIAGLSEAGATFGALVASIARAWLQQFADALEVLDPERSEPRFLLAGGLARHCPAMPAVLERLSGRRVLRGAGEDDETISGLAALAAS